MTAENFAYWLQGFFEITGELKNGLTPEQTRMIEKHLNMVFVHDIDPKMGIKEHQNKLNQIHSIGVIIGDSDYEEALKKWGPSPGVGFELSYLHGWYNPELGTPRC